MLVRDELLHVDVPRLTLGTVELTLDEVVLETFLTSRKRPAALGHASFVNKTFAKITLERRWHIEFLSLRLFRIRSLVH